MKQKSCKAAMENAGVRNVEVIYSFGTESSLEVLGSSKRSGVLMDANMDIPRARIRDMIKPVTMDIHRGIVNAYSHGSSGP